MKKTMALITLAAMTFSTGAFANSWLECQNGTFDEKGDGYLSVTIYEDGMVISPYESSLQLDAADLSYENGVFSVINKVVTMSGEGETWSNTINMIAVISEDNSKLQMAISWDPELPFRSETLTCKTVTEL